MFYCNKTNLFKKINKFKNNIQIDEHTVITYNNNNIFYTLSCGGFGDNYQHLEIYNHSLNKWMNNIKYNKKNYYIYYGAKGELININNKSYIIISCQNENDENYFYIFDIHNHIFINKFKKPKELNITFSFYKFIKYKKLENKYIMIRGKKIIYFSIDNNLKIKIIKNINTNLDNYYFGMSSLNINNKYIITFGGAAGHENNIYILEIDKYKFYKSKIKLKETFQCCGSLVDKNKMIHIFGGRYTNSHYIIGLNKIIPLNLNEIKAIINYYLKIEINNKNIRWVNDLNKIIFKFIVQLF